MSGLNTRTCQGPKLSDAWGSLTTAGTGAVTTNEAYGVTCARTNVGEITLTFKEKAKGYNFGFSVIFTTAAQSVFVKSKNAATGVVVLQIVTAGSATAVDTTGMTIDFDCGMRFTD